MLIYKDLVTGDEMFTDIYKINESADGFFIEVEGQVVTRSTDDIPDTLIGGNRSAEDMVMEDMDKVTESGVDFVLNCKLQETSFDKTSYKIYIKDYIKELEAKLLETKPEHFALFKEGMRLRFKDILGNMKNYQFFTGESMNPVGMVGLLDYRSDGTTPFMVCFKHGLEIEKA